MVINSGPFSAAREATMAKRPSLNPAHKIAYRKFLESEAARGDPWVSAAMKERLQRENFDKRRGSISPLDGRAMNTTSNTTRRKSK